MRALHLVNEPGSPAVQFVPPLERRGFEIDERVPLRDPLPTSLEGYDALVVGGGTMDTHETDRFPWLATEVALFAEAVERGVPALGLCLGAQLLTVAAGGQVERCGEPEVGWRAVDLLPAAAEDPLFAPVPHRFQAMQWHYYRCRLPEAAERLAANDASPQAFRVGDAAWGTQFHIEVDRTVLEHWLASAPEELAKYGFTAERWVEGLDTLLPAHEAIGRGLAERFARIALDRAGGRRAAATA